jgi:hypothetical protein
VNEMNEYTGRRPFIDPRNFEAEYAQMIDEEWRDGSCGEDDPREMRMR